MTLLLEALVMKYKDSRLPDRFWDKVIPQVSTGCFIWVASTSGGGYGAFWNIDVKERQPAHRYAYEKFAGPIAEGLVLDHWKMNIDKTSCSRDCVNVLHLEAVTQQENTLRGDARKNGANHRAKTHCPQGHEYTEANTYLYKGNKRNCRECSRRRSRLNARQAKMLRKVKRWMRRLAV